MRKNFIIAVLLLTLLTVFPLAAQTHSITVKISGMEEIKGKVQLRLFNSDETWLKKGEECCLVILDVDADTIIHTFTQWPDGRYGLAGYHDLNSNNEMDTNLFGMPRERYAFSNNARGKFGPPSFEKAAFTVEDSTVVQLVLKR